MSHESSGADRVAVVDLPAQSANPDMPEWLSALLPDHIYKLLSNPIPHPVEILTERLRVRELRSDDYSVLNDSFADRDHRQFVLPHQHGEAHVVNTLVGALVSAHANPRRHFWFAIENKNSNRFLGTAGFRVLSGWSMRALLGLEIDVHAAGKGIGTEVARSLAEFAFRTLGVDVIIAEMDGRNAACEAVMTKIGLRQVRLWPWQHFEMTRRYKAHIPFSRMRLRRAEWMAPCYSPPTPAASSASRCPQR